MPSAVLQHIPDEIWAEIFAHLSRKSLAHADLTNWRFHRITRPLLFRELEFHPYTCIAGYPVTRCPSSALALPSRPEDIDLVLQRLQFWSTESISPCVRTCRLSPWPNSGV
ncbi:hypothetical protein B0H13DRAFT_1589952, partial [Mycena leptocephala]